MFFKRGTKQKEIKKIDKIYIRIKNEEMLKERKKEYEKE